MRQPSETEALETSVRELSAKLREAEADVTRYHAALSIIGTAVNWDSDPRIHGAVLFGHFTAYEVARRALDGDES